MTTQARTRSSRIKLSKSDRIYFAVNNTVITLLLLVVLIPLVYIVSASFSSPSAVMSGRVLLWPVEPGIKGYTAVFEYKPVFIGYRNTAFYTIVGTFINVSMTLMAAYPLARGNLVGGKLIMFLFTFTMIFSGGLIPSYILMRNLNFINTVWAMLIPGAVSAYNMIITRTFIQNIPAELREAAEIDGCSDIQYFFVILMPLSKAVIAVITLYYAVGHWNAYFNAFLYLSNKSLFPLQLFLREILIKNTVDTTMVLDPEIEAAIQGMKDLLKYSLIVVATVPILCIYPFVQRYFIKGVMIGSIKG